MPTGRAPTPSHNLFDYATKELSQDAIICWLIARGSGPEPRKEGDRTLWNLGREFVDALLRKHDVSPLGDDRRVELHQQNLGIDVLARICDGDTSHVLLIEDKTDTNQHSGQLERYLNDVPSGRSALETVDKSSVRPIFFKTGNLSLAKRRQIEDRTAYRVFERKDLLVVLNGYAGAHPVVTDFREYLASREASFLAYKDWSPSDDRSGWSKEAWEGFYRALEEKLNDDDPYGGWGDVVNRGGAFLAFRWYDRPKEDHRLYIQLEVVPGNPKKQSLCFKLTASEETEGVSRLTGEVCRKYRELVFRAGNGRVIWQKPIRPAKWVTIGRWDGEWLAFGDDGEFDLDGTAENLRRAERIVDAVVNS